MIRTEFTISVMAIAGGIAEDHMDITMVKQGMLIMDIMVVKTTAHTLITEVDLVIMVVDMDMEEGMGT
ncbi:hypothetical protein D918_03845 [Trichuris suis]|nr:hypothetical protein D918_03845 [Trichuris suis]